MRHCETATETMPAEEMLIALNVPILLAVGIQYYKLGRVEQDVRWLKRLQEEKERARNCTPNSRGRKKT